MQMYEGISQEDDDEVLCLTCKGHGSTREQSLDDEGNFIYSWKFCEDCDGTGFQQGGDVD